LPSLDDAAITFYKVEQLPYDGIMFNRQKRTTQNRDPKPQRIVAEPLGGHVGYLVHGTESPDPHVLVDVRHISIHGTSTMFAANGVAPSLPSDKHVGIEFQVRANLREDLAEQARIAGLVGEAVLKAVRPGMFPGADLPPEVL